MSVSQEFVRSVVEMMKKSNMTASASFEILGEAGVVMPTCTIPVRRGATGLCYMNATRLVLDNPELRYCEGYAVSARTNIPLEHAWAITEEGCVLDPTWEDGIDYFGVSLNPVFISNTMLHTGYYGVFPNLYMIKKRPADIISDLRLAVRR